MDIFHTITAARIIFILGIVNLVTGTLLFLTCRCIPGWNVTSGLMKLKFYQRLFPYHCYLWWVFWPAVVVHIIFALAFMGFPF